MYVYPLVTLHTTAARVVSEKDKSIESSTCINNTSGLASTFSVDFSSLGLLQVQS